MKNFQKTNIETLKKNEKFSKKMKKFQKKN